MDYLTDIINAIVLLANFIFVPGAYLWQSARARCAGGNTGLWDFAVFQFRTRGYDGVWHDAGCYDNLGI